MLSENSEHSTSISTCCGSQGIVKQMHTDTLVSGRCIFCLRTQRADPLRLHLFVICNIAGQGEHLLSNQF